MGPYRPLFKRESAHRRKPSNVIAKLLQTSYMKKTDLHKNVTTKNPNTSAERCKHEIQSFVDVDNM